MAADPTGAARERPSLDPGAAARLSRWLREYRPLPGIPDELFDARRRPRDAWLALLGDIADYPEQDFNSRFAMAMRHIRDTGVSYRIYGESHERAWPLNPLPLILSEGEWTGIAEGVQQRATLMEALLRDLYGPGRLLADGALPAAALTGSADFLRAMRGVQPKGGRYLQLYAADIGRGPDGRWRVLGDCTQGPAGAGYALENRLVLSRAWPALYNAMNVHRLAPFFDRLRQGLAAAADRPDPRICLLTSGPLGETYFEQAHLARYLGLVLVEGGDLAVSDGRAYVRTIAGLKRADVILRRIDAADIDPLELNSQSRVGAPGLMEAIRGGGVAMLNMPGSGVLESRALLAFLPDLCRRLLGEELKMPHAATWWCGRPDDRALAGEDMDMMAIAPAFQGAGADGVSPHPRLLRELDDATRADFLRRLADRPGDFVAQELVRLSTTPILRDGRLTPASFVLRVYAAATPDGLRILPGGFCRTSEQPDARAIAMGEDLHTADVWVIADRPVERVTLLAGQEAVKIRRITGPLPSRAADNFYWLGRYLERAEAVLRLVRSLGASLMNSEAALHGAGDTLSEIQRLLVVAGALDERESGDSALETARMAMLETGAGASAISLAGSARHIASSLRERLSPDFWTVLLNLESRLSRAEDEMMSEAGALQAVETGLHILASLAGLSQENMIRGAGWRFFDMGRRLERGVNACRLARHLAGGTATVDGLDLLLDLIDTQITYRSRYLSGLALRPVRDIAVLDPLNPRSVAFQAAAIQQHLERLPPLVDDGMPEAPLRLILPLAAQLRTAEAGDLDEAAILGFERALLTLSDRIQDRYFLQGANAAPPVKLVGLA